MRLGSYQKQNSCMPSVEGLSSRATDQLSGRYLESQWANCYTPFKHVLQKYSKQNKAIFPISRVHENAWFGPIPVIGIGWQCFQKLTKVYIL